MAHITLQPRKKRERKSSERERFQFIQQYYTMQIWMPSYVNSHDYIVRKFAPREATSFRCVCSPHEKSLPSSKRHVAAGIVVGLRFVCTWLNILSIQRIRVTQETPTVSSHDSRFGVLENREFVDNCLLFSRKLRIKYPKCPKYALNEDIPMKIM